MNFEPIAYGITSVATYVISFNIEARGVTTFDLVGSGDAPNTGTYVFNGLWTVELILRNAPPTGAEAILAQVSGAPWRWYSSVIKFPDMVVGPL